MSCADHLYIAPSLLDADFAYLGQAAEAVSNADWLHVDVMDNHFVPNLTIGLPVVKSLRRATNLPLDCHLMIENPDRWAIEYAEAGAHNVTFHGEAAKDPVNIARKLRSAGALAGLALKPKTPLDSYIEILPEFNTLLIMTVEPGFGGQSFISAMLEKIHQARQHIDARHLKLFVEVDGGVNAGTIEQAAAAGADVFVAGSAVYGAEDPAAVVDALRESAANASRDRMD